jgi:hypothetical protein
MRRDFGKHLATTLDAALIVVGLLMAAWAASVLIAGPADASVLVIDERRNTGGGYEQGYELQAQQVLGPLNERGVVYTRVPMTAVTTAGARAGQVSTSWGTETHHAVIHLGYDTGLGVYASATYDPRTYLRGATWPSVPHLWILVPVAGAGTSNTATDTTGTNDFYPSGQAINGSLYATGTPWTWKNLYATVKPAVATTPRAAGIYRVLVGYGMTSASNTRNAVKNADSLYSRADNPDSAVVWMRSRYPNDPASQIFCYAGAGGIQDIAAIKVALAMLDSLTAITNAGGRVFTNRTRTTKKQAVVLTNATLTAVDHTTRNAYYGGGTYVVGDSSDQSNVLAGIDSLKGLNIRLTALVDPESTTSSRAVAILNALKAIPGARFGLQPVSGTFTGSVTRASAAGRCIDPIGISRRRTLWPSTPTTPTPSCATDSGSVYCSTLNGWNTLEALAPGRVDHVAAFAAFDWTPQEWTVASAGNVSAGVLSGGQDSLVAAIWAGGKTRVVLENPSGTGSPVGMKWSSSASNLTNNSAPAGWGLARARLPVVWGGVQRSAVRSILARWEPSVPTWRWQQESHPGIAQEYLAGSEARKYYLADAGVYYHHTFSVQTKVFAVPIGLLGGPYATPWPQRPGFWQIKWLVHGVNAANARLPRWADGTVKRLDEFDWVENLEP